MTTLPSKPMNRKEFLAHLQNLKTRKWKGIVVHHTLLPDYAAWKKHPDAGYWWAAIDKFHREKRGWKGIGYHWLVFPDGLITPGRPMTEMGAHVKGHNKEFVGVCLLGDFNTDEMANDQYISAWFVLTALVVKLGLTPERIWFHRDFSPTTCPGRLERQHFRMIVARHLTEMRQWLGR